MYDMHIHSKYSVDGRYPPEDFCRRALELGLDGIAFTDHLDIDYPGYEDIPDIDFVQYNSHIASLKGKYGPLRIMNGIEVGYQPHVNARNIEIAATPGFDFIILSVHVFYKLDPYNGNFYGTQTKQEAYSSALLEVHKSIKEFDNFDILGHFDYISRYGPYPDNDLLFKDFAEYLEPIFKAVIHAGKGIEVNTSTYARRADISPSSLDIESLKAYKKLGGEIIVLSSDAHAPEHLARDFEKYRDILTECGFRHAAYFVDRKPYFYKL